MPHTHSHQLSFGDDDEWLALPTPKIRTRPVSGVQSWVRAYAGFSEDFALAAIRSLAVSTDQVFLDPFVGSGTSAVAAAQFGVPFIGIDLDPFSALLSRAKVAINADNQKVHSYVKPNSDTVRLEFAPYAYELFESHDLSYASSVFRRLQGAFSSSSLNVWHCLLNDPDGKYDSEVAALASVVIGARGAAKVVRGSNPVWLRKSLDGEMASRRPLRTICQEFASKMLDDLAQLKTAYPRPTVRIFNSDFLKTALSKNSFDCIITSPPYLNRLDYVINHLPELAILSGFIAIDIEYLRRRMMGTTKMGDKGYADKSWGVSCTSIMEDIRTHSSKASSTYYYQFYCQYFRDLMQTLRNLRFVCKDGAKGLLVIQESYYKDIRIPLSEILCEMSQFLKIRVKHIRTEKVSTHMGTMSPIQKAYVPRKVLEEHVVQLEF